MSVEVGCYKVKRSQEDELKNFHRIHPGSSKNIDFLGPVRIAAFCDTDNMVGSIWVVGDSLHKRIRVIRYRDNRDVDGKKVEAGRCITIIGEQQLAITLVRGRKEVYFALDKGDETDQENDLDDTPQDVRPLVTV